MNRYIIFLLVISSLWSTTLQKQISKPTGRIIGGSQARAGQFPFIAAITTKTSTYTYFCGGSLLTAKYILTAGLCVDDGQEFTIQLGSNQLSGDDRYRTEASTNDYILHPDYNPSTLEANLGIVVLRLDLTLIVGYLWSVGYLPTEDLGDGEVVLAAGWGQYDDETPGPENDLRYAELVSLSNAECRLTYGNQITDDMVCVEGNYNEGTCIGDTGGPLVQNVRLGLMRQVGVASFVSGNGCESTDPSGFTRIFPHLDWIKNVTERN